MIYTKEINSSDYSVDGQCELIENMLGLPEHSVWDMCYTIEFGVSEYVNATFFHEAEGGDVSEARIISASYVIKYYDSWFEYRHGYLKIPIDAKHYSALEKYLPEDDKFYLSLADE